MTSPLLALFLRSLREGSRLKLTYFSRAALVLLIMLFLVAARTEMGWMNAPGLAFFEIVANIDLAFIILAGISYFTAAITEEKEEMTLGLLRMTNLNPLSIVLGKSTSRLCVALLLLAAQFPFTLLAITMGGIALPQIIAVYLTIGAFLIFVSNLALLTSVISRRTSAAAGLTGLSLLFMLLVLPMAKWLRDGWSRPGHASAPSFWGSIADTAGEFGIAISPFAQIDRILFPGGKMSFALSDSAQMPIDLAFGLIFFLLAWLGFDRFCGDHGEIAASRSGPARLGRRRRLLSAGRAWLPAITWKEFNFTTGGKRWLGIKCVIYAAILSTVLGFRGFGTADEDGVIDWVEAGKVMMWFAVLGIFAELALMAATFFRIERQGQTWSSLAMLPQGVGRVAYQKLLGLIPSLGAAGLCLFVGLVLAGPSIVRQTYWDWHWGDHPQFVGIAFFAAQSLLFLHLVTLLSLWVKQGALPLALGVQGLLCALAPWILGSTLNRLGTGVVLTIITVVVTAILHFAIGRRLHEVAGES